MQNRFKTKHDRTNRQKLHLQYFINYLETIDRFNARPAQIIIAEKDAIIAKQQEKIAELERQLILLNELEVKQQVMVEEKHLPTLIHLLQQIAELKLPSGRLF